MRFKNYVWPHNPRIYEIHYARHLACHKVPFGLTCCRTWGRTCRILRGSGAFAGPGAYEEFKRLATVFYDNRPGLLVHPLWQESNAYFVELSLREEPTENYVAYTFEFWESFDQYGNITEAGQPGYDTPKVNYHVLRPDETFWTLAAQYGGAEALLKLNSWIRNPNTLRAGDRIRVRQED
jgi:hypothetical protein